MGPTQRPDGSAPPPAEPFPRVPAYAWAWLQRSRPVLHEAARRLTGGPPSARFMADLRERFTQDPFTREVLIGVIADVAFRGRVPERRPPGASWDRGLTWWAAAIAGATPSEFERRSRAQPAGQRQLFAVETDSAPGPARSPGRRSGSPERVMLARALRELLAAAEGDQVPADAVRQLLTRLEPDT
ncbi:MAG TPA: hypothetical protein VG452_03545 [Egibacteraceae bacterium]|nr:hypothetical protein [Egibacteraceae bacterium]